MHRSLYIGLSGSKFLLLICHMSRMYFQLVYFLSAVLSLPQQYVKNVEFFIQILSKGKSPGCDLQGGGLGLNPCSQVREKVQSGITVGGI